MGCFSMYASKVLTAGEGGAIATNDDRVADKVKMIRNHGMVDGYDTRVLGLNLRLPELSAAVAKVQMQKLDKMLQLRRRNAELLRNKDPRGNWRQKVQLVPLHGGFPKAA